MLKFNGLKFAKNKKEAIASVFDPGGSVDGFYKVYSNRIMLYKLDGSLFACAVNNSYSDRFFVSARKIGSSVQYMYSLTADDQRYLNLDNMRYSDKSSILNTIFEDQQ